MTLWHTPAHVKKLLTDYCRIYDRVPNPDWTPDLPSSESTVDVPVWDGICSFGGGSMGGSGFSRSTVLDPDRTIETFTLRVQTPAAGGPGQLIVGGQIVTIDRFPERTWTIVDDRRRTTAVLQRITIVDTEYAEHIPR